ncbi:MAG: hypothetical protein PVG49_15725 [Desulfobacteraceae bacterium]
MRNRGIHMLLIAAMLALLLPASGCGTAKKMVQKVRSPRTDLKKRVLVLPILDQQGMGEEKIHELTTRLADALKKDPNLVVYTHEEPLPSTVTVRSPKFGIVIDPDLAQKAEEMGMNVLVTCVLNRFEVIGYDPGVWPLNKIPVWPFTAKEPQLEVSMVVNALNITNGTLFLTNQEQIHLRVPTVEETQKELIVIEGEERRSEAEMIAAVPQADREQAFLQILDAQAEKLVDSLREQVWAGRVLSAGPEKIMINAGQDIGLSEGLVFEVFGRGDPIRSVSGRSLYLLGPKVGEIQTVQVMERYASAVPVDGANFKAGQVIREKP